MKPQANDSAIDEIIATCNGDIRGALLRCEPGIQSAVR
jgi:hypothetical protein